MRAGAGRCCLLQLPYQPSHLLEIELLPGFDRSVTSEGLSNRLLTFCWIFISSQGIEQRLHRFDEIGSSHDRRHSSEQIAPVAEVFQAEAELAEQLRSGVESLLLTRAELDSRWLEKSLHFYLLLAALYQDFIEDDALMCRMLVDEVQPRWTFCHDIAGSELPYHPENGYRRRVSVFHHAVGWSWRGVNGLCGVSPVLGFGGEQTRRGWGRCASLYAWRRCLVQGAFNCPCHCAVDRLAVAELDLGFAGVDIDIEFLRW